MSDLRIVTVAQTTQGLARLARALHAADAPVAVEREVAPLDGDLGVDGSVDVVVMETAGNRHDRIRFARRALPSAVLVVVVPDRNRRRLRNALAEGADGIVSGDRLDALVPTIRAACAGQVVVPRELRTSIVKPSLSVREKQVLGMVVLGFTNGEIAQRLVLAESTIKSHLSSAFAKLGVRSRGEATELILDPANGLGHGILSITGVDGTLGADLPRELTDLARR